jgi:hypothetical protein
MEIISAWWGYEVRLFPVLLALSIYTGVQLLRKLTKFWYTPSYFAIFPLSMLEGQFAEYFGEDTYGEYLSIKKGRKTDSVLFGKALVSIFLTFGVVPLVTGFLVAFLLTRGEFTGFLFLLIGAEAVRCATAVYDFANYRGNWKSVILYFGSFYALYLFCLWAILRIGYRFVIPFVEGKDYAGLLDALEGQFVPIVIYGLGLAIVAGLFSHFLLNKDTIMPAYAEYSDMEEDSETPDDD